MSSFPPRTPGRIRASQRARTVPRSPSRCTRRRRDGSSPGGRGPRSSLRRGHAPHAPPPSSMIDAALRSALADRYRIEREIGAGGMATVYLAEDLKHRRKVALKVLRPELGAALGAERFLREIEDRKSVV